MIRRVAIAVAVLGLLISSMGGVMAQTQENGTATPTPAPTPTATAAPDTAETDTESVERPGPYKIGTLRENGEHPQGAPPSVRELGDPAKGQIALQHAKTLSTGNNQWDWVKPDSTIETDTLRLYAPVYNEEFIDDFSLVIVYWQEERRQTPNGTATTVATNQTVQRVGLSFDRGQNLPTIKLRSHYETTKEVTLWLEHDGTIVDGAKWRLTHRSNPLTASPAWTINSKGDLWKWGAVFILLPALPGIFVGRKAARHMISRTITSPRKGAGWWLMTVGILSLLLVGLATWQTAAVLARAPIVAGLFIAAVSFVAMLGMRDSEVERAEFNRKNLEDVTSVSGEESKRAREEDILLRQIVRRDGHIYMPSKGIRPFLARYWADPAKVPESDINTVNNTEGDVSKKYEIDPGADQVLDHTPARLTFNPTIIKPRDEDAVPPEGFAQLVEDYVDRLNWSFIGASVLGGAAVYYGSLAALGVESLSMALALLPAIVAGYEARDGSLDFEPAPYHFSEARAILAHERSHYREARTFEDLHSMVADLDLDVIEQTQETTEAIREQLRDRINDMFGVPGQGSSSENSDFDFEEPPAESGVSDD